MLHANLEIVQRNPLAVEHPVDVVIGLNEELRRIGKGLVPSEPCRLGMTMWTDDGQPAHLRIQAARNRTLRWIRGKQSIVVKKRHRSSPAHQTNNGT